MLPDQGLIVLASDDFFDLGVVSSRVHVEWSLAQGGTLEDRPRYNNSRCFETFPFPDEDTGLTPDLRQTIASLAEQIDRHRKRVLGDTLSKPLTDNTNKAVPASPSTPLETLGRDLPGADFWAFDSMRPPANPATAQHEPPRPQEPAKPSKNLTLTGLYNVLDKLRQNLPLTPADKQLHEHGLVSLLRTLHDELDAAVLQAYGYGDLGPVPWGKQPAQQAWTDALLTRLVALNAQRASEEQQGSIRWLRPAFQDPVQRQQQAEMLLNVELLAHTPQGVEPNLAYKTPETQAQTDHDATHAPRSGNNGKNAPHGKADSRTPPHNPGPSRCPSKSKPWRNCWPAPPGR